MMREREREITLIFSYTKFGTVGNLDIACFRVQLHKFVTHFTDDNDGDGGDDDDVGGGGGGAYIPICEVGLHSTSLKWL